MKKSFNVNLGGRIFQIDEDAYEKLNDYLVSLRTCFMNNECGEEIAADIEARLGELFEERVGDGTRIITISLVNEMIARMGNPESIVEDEPEQPSDTTDGSENRAEGQNDNGFSAEEYIRRMSMGKKLFRDGDNKLIAGVISGLSAYLGVNVTLLRVIAVFLFFVTAFWTFLIYLVMWAVVPLAVTTTDKLRMQGVEPTPENIAEKITVEEPAIDKVIRNLKEVDNKGLTNLLIILGCVLFLTTFVFGVSSHSIFANFKFLPILFMFTWIGVISLVAIPVIAIVLVLSNRWSTVGGSAKLLLLIDWILALIQVAAFMSAGVGYFTLGSVFY
ncbi:MAG: PspC domain-containing protein [Bacteroidaceae bacterium]|nr:PspC domain-containing protein [Bacteroidaceae bacterium]